MKKILLDSGIINRGGSLQVALSTIHYASLCKKYEWYLLASRQVASQINSKTKKGFRTIKVIEMKSMFDRLSVFSVASSYCTEVSPDLVFTIFGPTYWHPNRPHVQGFALPLLVYDKESYRNPFAQKGLDPKGYLLDGLKKALIKRSDFVVVETERIKKLFCERIEFPKEKVFVIENSYSPIFDKTMKRKVKMRPTLRPVVFVPSAYYPHKNLEIVPSIARILKERNTDVLFRFLLDPAGKPWEVIQSMSRELDVENFVETVGNINHNRMAEYYRRSSVVFLPTLVEASTAVYPESFMASVPLITSNRDFAKELCGDAALYCDPTNPVDGADKILQLLKSTSKRNELIKKGKNMLRKSYLLPGEKWTKTIGLIEKILKNSA